MQVPRARTPQPMPVADELVAIASCCLPWATARDARMGGPGRLIPRSMSSSRALAAIQGRAAADLFRSTGSGGKHRRRWGPARELRALRRLQREASDVHIFVSERGAPLSVAGYQRMVARAGEAARFPFLIHSHMLRHSCGYKLANDGHDTRAIQHYLGHRSIASTVRYTALAPDRFRGFWKD
jgi:integrase